MKVVTDRTIDKNCRILQIRLVSQTDLHVVALSQKILELLK